MGLFTTPSLPSLASAAAAGAPGLAAAGGCAAGPGEAGAPRLLEATRGAWGVGVGRPERATRSFTPSCSSSNSVMSCSSRIRRISLISLTSKRFPPLPVGLRRKAVLFPPATGLSRKRLLELPPEAEASHPQRKAGSSGQGPRGEGGKEEVLPGDRYQDRHQPLRDHPQLREVSEAGVGRGGHTRPQQGRVLGGHCLHVRVGTDHQLLDRNPIRA